MEKRYYNFQCLRDTLEKKLSVIFKQRPEINPVDFSQTIYRCTREGRKVSLVAHADKVHIFNFNHAVRTLKLPKKDFNHCFVP